MPAIAIQGGRSTGHGSFPPTPDVGPYTTTAFFSGRPIQLRGVTKYAPHSSGDTTHPSSTRKIADAGGTFYMEGKLCAMIGDTIECGDAVGKGAPSAFIS